MFKVTLDTRGRIVTHGRLMVTYPVIEPKVLYETYEEGGGPAVGPVQQQTLCETASHRLETTHLYGTVHCLLSHAAIRRPLASCHTNITIIIIIKYFITPDQLKIALGHFINMQIYIKWHIKLVKYTKITIIKKCLNIEN